MNQKNQDYAFFQVVYSDIPVVRSLNGILPGITTIDLQLTATVNYYDTEETRDYDIYAQIHLKFDEV